ncbi:MAG: transketolase family protein [Bacteroidales bacterium]|nr:transketolase family protein [Candidatus Cacconaster scatequi]
MTEYKILDNKDTRSGFGAGLVIAADKNPAVVGLVADLTPSLKMGDFAKKYPGRFYECGIAEANMAGVAAGLAITGKIPFIGSFAEFVSGRIYDQVRQEIAYGNTNVKIASSHAGITLGEDGATHQTMEDVALMRALPGMTVVAPCDYNQAVAATVAAAEYEGPVYLRFGRPVVPVFTAPDQKFEIGKAYVMNPGKDVTILCYGHLVWPCLQAATLLEKGGVSAEVINVATIKPLDTKTILASLDKTGRCVICEEHNLAGGLGEAVCTVLAQEGAACKVKLLNGADRWGESGTPAELLKDYNFTPEYIAELCRKLQ